LGSWVSSLTFDNSPASFKAASYCSRYFCRLQLQHKAATLCLQDKHLAGPHINKKK